MRELLTIQYPKIGICGLSCRLCPAQNTEAKSKCNGCKSEYRMRVGCIFITCAIKKRGIEFCWQCIECNSCEKWIKHRKASKHVDSFKCYQTLEEDIALIQQRGVKEFQKNQKIREQLLKEMLKFYNEGRSKSYYCIAATVLQIDELKSAINQANMESKKLDIKSKSKILHSKLDEIAKNKNYLLKLRK